MPRQTHIEPHHSLKALQNKRKGTRDKVRRQQLKVICLLLEGHTQREVAERCGYSSAWVHTIVKRYNSGGLSALRDHRRDNPGRPYRLSAEVRREMKALVSSPPPEGGLWTGPKLVEWVRARTGDESIDYKRGWEWLKQLNCKRRLTRRSRSHEVTEATELAS
jgi:transposase